MNSQAAATIATDAWLAWDKQPTYLDRVLAFQAALEPLAELTGLAAHTTLRSELMRLRREGMKHRDALDALIRAHAVPAS